MSHDAPINSIQVAVAIVIKDGRILLTRRAAASHLPNLWEFPGGKIEPGETPEECVSREVREETGLEVIPDRLFETTFHRYADREVTLQFYICRVTRGFLNPTLMEAAWRPISDLAILPMPPANDAVIQRILKTK